VFAGLSFAVWVLGFVFVVAVIGVAVAAANLAAAHLPVVPGRPSKGRRGFALALVIATALAAWGLPRMIPDGIAGLSGRERDFALAARSQAWQFMWENPLERLSITRIMIAYVEAPPEPATPEYSLPARAVVYAFTLFGLPYSRADLNPRSIHANWRLPTPLLAWALVGGIGLAACALWREGGRRGDDNRPGPEV